MLANIACHISTTGLPHCPLLSPDDPFWWSAEEQQLVQGTRLGRAIEQYRPGLSRITAWAGRLEELRRCELRYKCGEEVQAPRDNDGSKELNTGDRVTR